MKCPNCEHEVENSANFCPKCGKAVSIENFFDNANEDLAKKDASLNQGTTQSIPHTQTPPVQQYPYPPQYPAQPPTQQPPFYQQYPYYPPQPAPISEKNGMAIAGFVCSFFIPLLGWIFGGIGLSRANKRNGKGKGFSIAAIAISTVMFFISLLGNQ